MDTLVFGEVLWDVIEGVPYLGGAPLNFAAHARRCGLETGLISAVGADALGERTRAEVRRQRVDDTYLFTDPAHPTGTVEVTLTNGIPAYDIKEPVAWDAIAFPEGMALPPPPKAFYFGTLAMRNPVSHRTLSRLLAAYPEAVFFFDVNLRQRFWSLEALEEGLRVATILKLNDEESERLAPLLIGEPLSLEAFPEALFTRYPGLRCVVTTMGGKGCLVSVAEGNRTFRSPAFDAGPVVDTVGAGDAFSAAFLAAVLQGKSLEEAAEAGNRRGGWVATRPGAIPEE
ncbi:MAG: carbohydrate kinase [Kiritimatiellae bacterium]|nr:carbohydrate kinase [Kiritimatiellia bacterium]